MNRGLHSLVSVLALCALGCWPRAYRYEVYGRVLDARTGRPVKDATITLGKRKSPRDTVTEEPFYIWTQVRTAEDGVFRFRMRLGFDFSPSRIVYRIEREGYKTEDSLGPDKSAAFELQEGCHVWRLQPIDPEDGDN